MFGQKARRDKTSERVSRGMQALDKNRPGWHRRINLDRLDISSGTACALGQTYGLYGWGKHEIGMTSHADVVEHGFQITPVLPGVTTQGQYERLTIEWRRQIEERLDAERAEWAKQQAKTPRRRLALW